MQLIRDEGRLDMRASSVFLSGNASHIRVVVWKSISECLFVFLEKSCRVFFDPQFPKLKW